MCQLHLLHPVTQGTAIITMHQAGALASPITQHIFETLDFRQLALLVIVASLMSLCVPAGPHILIVLLSIPFIILPSSLIFLMYLLMNVLPSLYRGNQALLLILHCSNPELVRLLDRGWRLSPRTRCHLNYI